MTDNDTIQAWEFCTKRKTISDCIGCPYRVIENCLDTMLKDSFDLYNRQKADVKRLTEENIILSQKRANIFEIIDAYGRGRTEAIIELVDKVKDLFSPEDEVIGEIENIKKEMTESK